MHSNSEFKISRVNNGVFVEIYHINTDKREAFVFSYEDIGIACASRDHQSSDATLLGLVAKHFAQENIDV